MAEQVTGKTIPKLQLYGKSKEQQSLEEEDGGILQRRNEKDRERKTERKRGENQAGGRMGEHRVHTDHQRTILK